MKIAHIALAAIAGLGLVASAFAADAPKTPPPAPTLVPIRLVVTDIKGRGQDLSDRVNTSRYEGAGTLTIGKGEPKAVTVVVEARSVKAGDNRAVVEGGLIIRNGTERTGAKRLNLIVTGDTFAGWAEGEQVLASPPAGFRPVANLKANVTGGVSSAGTLSLTLDGFLVLRPVEEK